MRRREHRLSFGLLDVLSGARGVVIALALLGAVPPVAAADLSSTPDRTVAVNGTVRAIVRSPDRIYLGGDFSRIGTTTPYGAALNTSTGLANLASAKPNGRVLAVVTDGVGGYYIGGDFTAVGGVPRSRLAHITNTGTVDAFDPSPSGIVNTLVRSGSTLYAGGAFTRVNTNATPKPRGFVAAFDTTIATDNATAFDPSLGNEVLALALRGTYLYAGGKFNVVNVNATPKGRQYLAAFDTTTATDNARAFDPSPDSYVTALVLPDAGTVYAGGWFTKVNTNTTQEPQFPGRLQCHKRHRHPF